MSPGHREKLEEVRCRTQSALFSPDDRQCVVITGTFEIRTDIEEP
jgi:hypothetical protein